ncbi:septation protein A [Hyphomicrobium sp.]|uniref:septation protein A n=1 Tax=Hyphomicrobium sp. TaxID=82 RepID=UPI002C4AEFA0|nr:septation protein A [Hyphomicrobium sp.]HRN89829.1 septation protein A [Hyphomicrobium sp.]HRQ26482.1 septation protein A [Hyphomicrobium sp.]
MSQLDTKSAAGPQNAEPPLLKFLLELGPLVVFFIVNARADIFWGTGCFVVATIVSLTASRILFGKIPVMPLVSGIFVVLFGSLTLYLQDELFIKLKPTIVNGIFASILFGGLLLGHSLLKYLFGDVFALTAEGWRKLTFRWACFFVFLAMLNEVTWRLLSTDAWVSFKLFGIMPITMAFAISQVGLLKRYALDTDPNN